MVESPPALVSSGQLVSLKVSLVLTAVLDLAVVSELWTVLWEESRETMDLSGWAAEVDLEDVAWVQEPDWAGGMVLEHDLQQLVGGWGASSFSVRGLLAIVKHCYWPQV